MTGDQVQIVDLLTWQLAAMGVLVHCPVIHESFSRARLKENCDRTGRINICQPITETLYELDHVGSRSKQRRLLQFSAEAQYLATYEPVYPNTLWVWNLTSTTVLDTIVVLTGDIKGLLWHSEKHVLAASLTNYGVLIWKPQEALIVYPEENQCPLTAQSYFATVYNSDFNESLTI